MADVVLLFDANGKALVVGQTTMSASLPVALASDQSVLIVGGTSLRPSATFTRPNDSNVYTANDAVNNSTSSPTVMSFTSAVRVSAGSGLITGATLVDEANQSTPGLFNLYLFTSSPTMTNDNAALAIQTGDLSNLIGMIPFNASYTSNAAAGASGNRIFPSGPQSLAFKLGSGTTIYGMLQAANAYTPVTNEVFIVYLSILAD